jgi:hypothetical protein
MLAFSGQMMLRSRGSGSRGTLTGLRQLDVARVVLDNASGAAYDPWLQGLRHLRLLALQPAAEDEDQQPGGSPLAAMSGPS